MQRTGKRRTWANSLLREVRLRGQLLKKHLSSAALEDVDIGEYVTEQRIIVEQDPFPHAVIDDFFKPGPYERLVRNFNEVLARGLTQEFDNTRFRPFLELKDEFAYDGYVYAPRFDESDTLALLSSLTWNAFFSSLFRQPTTLSTNVAFHYHPPGDKTGFVHHDYVLKAFSPAERLSNGVIPYVHKEDGSELLRERRIIALIYYLGNTAEWKKGDGGETGLYRSRKEGPMKLIEPRNNRLLAFKLSESSLHAFQHNTTPRASIVQWFHSDDAWGIDIPPKPTR